MKKHLILVLVAQLFLCISTSSGGVAADAEPFSPKWHVGDQWTVQAVYRSYPDQEEWSQPVFWNYGIVDRMQENGTDYLVMEVWDRDGCLNVTSRLVYRAENLSLIRAEITKMRRGKEIVKVLTREDTAPAVTEQTLTPYDTPVFPLICPSLVDFTITRNIDGLRALRSVRQEVGISTVDDLPDRVSGVGLIEVRCTGTDGPVFTQWWDRNLPWPVYGENTNMKYWLVRE